MWPVGYVIRVGENNLLLIAKPMVKVVVVIIGL